MNEVIEKLEKKVKDYEGLMDELELEPRKIATVRSASFKKGTHTFHRCVLGGDELVMSVSPIAREKFEINDEVIVIKGVIMEKVVKELQQQKKVETYNLVKWDEIGGLEHQIEEIKSVVDVTIMSNKYAKEFGVKPMKGLLLWGPPGCGKTLIVKAIVRQILGKDTAERGEFVYVKGAELLSKWVGDTEQAIISIFKEARDYEDRTKKKSVIFIDEAEAILGQRGKGLLSSTVVPTFLSEMDGLGKNTPFMILSTNRPEDIDDAVMRDGRIDVKIKVDRPEKADAEKIFAVHIKSIKCGEPCENLAKIATEILYTSPLKPMVSGAMIANMVNLAAKDAMMRIIKNSKAIRGVTSDDLHTALVKLY